MLSCRLAKIGIDGVNSNLAAAIRTVVVVAMACGIYEIESEKQDCEYLQASDVQALRKNADRALNYYKTTQND